MEIKDSVIILDKKYDSTNASLFEEELTALVNGLENKNDKIVLDASNTVYISSAGLRVLLKLQKQYGNVSVINVSKEVYDIFEVTGFTSILDVKKAYRNIDLSNAVEIGHGFSSVAYRINEDTIVKLYHKRMTLEKIEKEAANAKKAFIFGVQTIISYDIVKCGEQFGTVFELVDSDVFSTFLNKHPDLFEEYSDKYIKLLKEVHSTEVDDSFIEVKNLWHKWSDMLAERMTETELTKIHELIDTVPDRNTMIHSDIHVNNIMTRNGELILIDMADLGRGHPIFDIAPLCFHYKYMEISRRSLADSLIVLNHDLRLKMWEKLKNEYLYDENSERHEALIRIYDCFGALRCGLIAAKHAQMEEEQKQCFVKTMKENLFPIIDEIIPLAKKYL